MRSFPTVCLLLALVIGGADALAQPFVLPYVGYTLSAGYDNGASYLALETDDLDTQGGVVLGLAVDIPVLPGRFPIALSVRPAVETALVSGETVTFAGGESVELSQRFWQAGVTFVGDVPVGRSPVAPYLGLGLTYARYSADFDTAGGAAVVGSASVSAWALAPNLAAGVRYGGSYGRRRVAPYVEARYRFATPSPTFSDERPGENIDNGFSVVAGARIRL